VDFSHPEFIRDQRLYFLNTMANWKSALVAALLNVFLCTQSITATSDYCARFTSSEGTQMGYFSMQIGDGQSSYSFNLDLSKFAAMTSCDLSQGLYYHIHSYWAIDDKTSALGSTECGSTYTGGHYDPNLACSSSSQSASAECSLLGRTSNDGYTYNCTTANYQAGKYALCEVGDLSGKFGIVYGDKNNHFASDGELVDYQPPYAANYMSSDNIATMWSSVIFYCVDSSKTRLACAKLIEVDAGTCGHPQAMHSVNTNAGVAADASASASTTTSTSAVVDTDSSTTAGTGTMRANHPSNAAQLLNGLVPDPSTTSATASAGAGASASASASASAGISATGKPLPKGAGLGGASGSSRPGPGNRPAGAAGAAPGGVRTTAAASSPAEENESVSVSTEVAATSDAVADASSATSSAESTSTASMKASYHESEGTQTLMRGSLAGAPTKSPSSGLHKPTWKPSSKPNEKH
jgi:hypothetical protein